MLNQTLQLIVMTRNVGYKSQAETIVNIEYNFETVKNDFLPRLLGETFERPVFKFFGVQGLNVLTKEYDGALSHIEKLVSQYLINGDQPYLTSQVVYRNDPHNKALADLRRFQKSIEAK